MKILAGTHKGRKLIVPGGIRPVSVLMRKACFDILGEEVKEKRILDLFAGSGALGLEALSRGGREAVFVDKNRTCLAAVERNVRLLGEINRTTLCFKDAFLVLQEFRRLNRQFDLVFLDPPYYQAMVTKALQALEEYDIVARFAYVVGFCYEKDDFDAVGTALSLIVRRSYGQSTLVIYRNSI